MGRKLLWASPLPPRQTDIANATARLRAALSGTPAAPELELFDCDRMPALSAQLARALRPGLPVYNLGNDARFHGDIFLACRRWPGLALAHDSDLSISLDQTFAHLGHTPESFCAQPEAPLKALDWLTANALAVITHNPAEEARLLAELDRPVFALPLVWQRRALPPPAGRKTGPFRLIMFGFMGTNRGLDIVLDMLRQFQGPRPLRLDIYGPLAPGSGLEKLLDDADFGPALRYHGYVPEVELDAALRGADLALNLRLPSMGEASGSQLRIWDAGTPAAVCNTGWWASLPDGLAFRFAPGPRLGADLATLISHLMVSPETGQSVARAGRAWLGAEHGIARWCAGMAEIEAALPALWRGWRERRDLGRPGIGGQTTRLAHRLRTLPLPAPRLAARRNNRAIAFVTDGTYAGAVAYVASRLCRSAERDGVDLTVLVTDEAALELLRRHAPALRLVPAGASLAQPTGTSHVSAATWAKLAMVDALAPAYERVLYLDADIVPVRRDLGRLFALDMQGHALAAVRDLAAHYDPTEPEAHRPAHLGLGGDLRYFNAGMMLIDPARFAADGLAGRALDFARDQPERCPHNEQCALNAALADDWLELSPRWNWIWRYGGGDERLCNWLASVLPISCLHLAGPLKPWADRHGELAHRWRAPWAAFLTGQPWAGAPAPFQRRALDFTARRDMPPAPLERRHTHPGALAALPAAYDRTCFADVAQGLVPAFPALAGLGDLAADGGKAQA